MIRDNETQLVTATPFDLETVSPGPGEPITMVAVGIDASLAITHCDTVDGTYTALMTVLAPAGTLEFRLPSNTQQFIQATFAAGDLMVSVPGNQTAV